MRVYHFTDTNGDGNLNEWTQLGDDIDGEAAGDNSGISVSLSSDGTIVAIGAPDNDGNNGNISGHVRVYQIDETNTTVLVNNDFLTVNEGISLMADAPASSTSSGTIGEIRVDDIYIYVCTATNNWKRIMLSDTTW